MNNLIDLLIWIIIHIIHFLYQWYQMTTNCTISTPATKNLTIREGLGSNNICIEYTLDKVFFHDCEKEMYFWIKKICLTVLKTINDSVSICDYMCKINLIKYRIEKCIVVFILFRKVKKSLLLSVCIFPAIYEYGKIQNLIHKILFSTSRL